MMKILYLTLAMVIFASCDKTPHGFHYDPETDENEVCVSLRTSDGNEVKLNDANVYWFDSDDKLCLHTYYPSMKDLALSHSGLKRGSYTIIAVVNIGKSLQAREESVMTLVEFLEWLSIQEPYYDNLYSGLAHCQVEAGVQVFTVDISSGAINEAKMELLFNVPSPRLPEFKPSRNGVMPALRAVVHLYDKSTQRYVTAKRAMLSPTSIEGVYSMPLSMLEGDYDLLIWVDYTTEATVDNHYITTAPAHVTILAHEDYTANSDVRDCFAQSASISITTGENPSQTIQLYRPVAKYRLVANDLEKYNKDREKKGWPPIEDLKIKVTYQGYIISSYSIKHKAPDGSKSGYKYTSAFSEFQSNEVTVGTDYVLVNGTESLVNLDLTFTDEKDEIISRVNNMRVDHKAGYLTTVRGAFLTAGNGGGQVEVDTEWDGNYNVYF